MQFINIERLTVPPRRQRESMAKGLIEDLAESIADKGLLHPIVVRKLPSEDPNGLFQLVCGERRLTAVKLLHERKKLYYCNGEGCPSGWIGVTLIGDLTDIQRKEAELEENILRVDLTWQEKNKAIADLHELRSKQNPEQTIADTGAELAKVDGRSPEAASKDVMRAKVIEKHIEKDSRVANARSQREAYNIIRRDDEAMFRSALAKATGEQTAHILETTDCTEWFPAYGGPPFDCILTDPPYGMGADTFGDAGASHEYEDTPERSREIYTAIIRHGFTARITKPAAHLYLFCDTDSFAFLKECCASAGWTPWRTPLIWSKGSIGHDPNPGIGFKRTYEMILYAYKGNRPCRSLVDDVLTIRPDTTQGHAAAKPVELFKRLIDRSCNPGDSVLDPCCGTGTIFPAATKCMVKATGLEISRVFANLAEARRFSKE